MKKNKKDIMILMKKNKIIILSLLFILLIIVFLIPSSPLYKGSASPTPTGNVEKTDIENACTKSGGVWLKDYGECEGAGNMLSEPECVKLGGKYIECESPCRHNPEAEACITLCMKVCKF